MPARHRSAVAPGVYDRGNAFQVRVRRTDRDSVLHEFIETFPYDPAARAASPHSRPAVLTQAMRAAADERAALLFRKSAASDLPERQTLGGWVDKWLHDPKAKKRGSFQREASIFSMLAELAPRLLSRPVVKLTARDFGDTPGGLVAIMDAAEYKPESIARYLAAIGGLWKASRRWGFDIPCPLRDAERPHEDDRRERLISASEWQAIMTAMREASPATLACVAFLRWTGMRRGAAMRLDWSDMDWSTEPPKARIRKPKAGKPRRVPLLPPAVAALATLRQGGKWPTHGKVFPVATGTITQAWVRAVERAGLRHPENEEDDPPRLHDLRHTRLTEITRLLPLADAMLISGHTRAGTLIERYYNRDAADIGAELWEAEKRLAAKTAKRP